MFTYIFLIFLVVLTIIFKILRKNKEYFEVTTTTQKINNIINNDKNEQNLFEKSQFFNELSIRILEEQYTKDNLNKLKLNEKLNILDKLAKINYYLPLDIFKDKSYKDTNNLIENKKLSMELSNEIIKYYLRALDLKQQKIILEILKKQYIYIPLIYFNNLSYVNSLKFIRKILNPKFKYPINVFNENKIFSKEIFSKYKNPDLNKYFKNIDTIQRPMDDIDFKIIPNNKNLIDKKNNNNKIDNDIEFAKMLVDDKDNKDSKMSISKKHKIKLELASLNNKILKRINESKPYYKINYENLYNKIISNNEYVVDKFYLDNLKENYKLRERLINNKNDYLI